MYYIVQVCEYLECRTKLARTKGAEGVFVPGLVWVMRKWTYFEEVVDLNWTHSLKHNALSVSPVRVCFPSIDLNFPRNELQYLSVLDQCTVCSAEWKYMNMSQQEEDLILRMYKLVGDRVPGRETGEMERFEDMRNNTHFFLPSSRSNAMVYLLSS
ncbi:hypothetical protein YC2023_095790 [Brassica napus]